MGAKKEEDMTASLFRLIQAGAVFAALGAAPVPQTPTQLSLSGLIDDYTPATVNGSPAAWEVRGEWSLNIKGVSGKADFTASLDMIRSDLWVLTGGNPNARSHHAHHVSMVDASVTSDETGYHIDGPAVVTVNGSDAPFAATIQIDVTGGTRLQYSNIRLTFSGGAENHFGAAPLHGVVRIE
jgi:hypothetical protein